MYSENELLIKEIVGAIRKFVRAVSLDAFKISKKYGLTGPQSTLLRTLIKEGPPFIGLFKSQTVRYTIQYYGDHRPP
jgi:hypothetical protein